MGHGVIAYVAYEGVTEAAIKYVRLGYTEAAQNPVASSSFLIAAAGTNMHFAKATLLSSPIMIEQVSISGFFIPGITISGTLLIFFTSNKFKKLSDSKMKVLYISTGTGMLVIGMFPGIAAMTTTLGEYIDFDHTLVNLADSDEGWKDQLLHTIGLERITVGSLITMSFYAILMCAKVSQSQNR